tara:strand:- start:7126 stop:8196 length:1071 start_codon:yes stop_codon:yes gene_type:complete
MKKRIKNLDPLRGLLAILVLLYHLPLVSSTVGLPYFNDLPIFHRGYEAVAVFFCLSGYLIIGLLYDEKKKVGAIDIKNFYLRRILRLYPVYYLVMFFGFFFYHFLLPLFHVPYQVDYDLYKGLLLCIGFLPNVFTKLYDPGSILSILWSIGIEEQFYLIIAPVLFILPLHRFAKYLLIFTILYFIAFHTEVLSFLMDFGFFYFFMSMGGLLAVWQRKGYSVAFRPFILRLVVYLMFALHITSDLFQFENVMVQNGFELILFNLLIVNLGNDERITISSKFANYVGKVSYGIYMYHMIVINFVLFVFLELQKQMVLNTWMTVLMINAISISLTIFMSHISYRYFESYFLNLKKRFRK